MRSAEGPDKKEVTTETALACRGLMSCLICSLTPASARLHIMAPKLWPLHRLPFVLHPVATFSLVHNWFLSLFSVRFACLSVMPPLISSFTSVVHLYLSSAQNRPQICFQQSLTVYSLAAPVCVTKRWLRPIALHRMSPTSLRYLKFGIVKFLYLSFGWGHRKGLFQTTCSSVTCAEI